ncbi:helix-turn-helix transcriptional regulator [Nocardia ignorata]|uniref:AlpA family transcriptional regulator n=1 Tax=Nocardia ignorata TaxID=145285 RepID=A0A4R6P376_NOCIG|nr:helix-turn-helix domain-containing protein [Nocardia ignorata]TDP29741.1 hypothetical protein DFR75_1122 [Nocardia ignorata]
MTETDSWLTRDEVADMIRFSSKTLANWSSMKPPKGPRAYRVSGKARYLRSEVEAWKTANLNAGIAA